MWERLEQREIARRELVPGPGERPRPDLPAGSDLIPKIKHIVVLMMENHSYDNYLGMMTGRGDGLSLGPDGAPTAVNVLPNGQRIPAHHLSSTKQVGGDPTQTWNACHISYGNGDNSGQPGLEVRSQPRLEPWVGQRRHVARSIGARGPVIPISLRSASATNCSRIATSPFQPNRPTRSCPSASRAML